MDFVYPKWELTEHQKLRVKQGTLDFTKGSEYCFICCSRQFVSKTKKAIKKKFKRHKLGLKHQRTHGSNG